MFSNKRILITGGTGSWGHELTRLLLKKDVRKIIIYSRGELAQVEMSRKFNSNKIKYVIGDVRDFDTLNRNCKDVDIVYHLAALKHVPVCEDNVIEAIKTNIDGTINVVNACLNNRCWMIDVSTDKAVSPTNLYGMTKAVAEKVVLSNGFNVVRGGNVLGSNGSVVPYFIQQIKENNRITITDDRMTRFFLTLTEAINLLFLATEKGQSGEIFVMNMPSFKITDLAEILKGCYGDENTIIDVVGSRPGEKIHEVLISEHENSVVYNDDFFLIKEGQSQSKEFSSENTKSYTELYDMLNKGGFLKNNK